MIDDGRTLLLGALGGLLLGSAALSGSRSSSKKPIWIHYDAIAKKAVQQMTDMANELIRLGKPKAEVNRLLADAVAREGEVAQRAMQFIDVFLAAGQQVFVVGPKLEQMFVNTSLDRVPRDILQAPFAGFWVALPGSELRLWSRRNGWATLRGMYVDMSKSNQIRLLLYAPCPTNKEPDATNENYHFLDLDEVYGSRGGGDLEGYLVDKLGEAIQKRMLSVSGDVLAEITSTFIQSLRIAINLLLYVNAGGAELTPDPGYLAELMARKALEAEKRKVQKSGERERSKRREIERIDEKAAKLSGATVVWLGKSIEEAAASETGAAEGAKRRRHWVRGHWRVPVRKSGERLLVWVQPYERYAEEEARVIRHTYRAKDDQA